jgi:hypothetical protein
MTIISLSRIWPKACAALSIAMVFSSTQGSVAQSLPDGIECVQPYQWSSKYGTETERAYLEDVVYIGARNVCDTQIIAVICVQRRSNGLWTRYFADPVRVNPRSYWANELLNQDQYQTNHALGCYENTACMGFLSDACSRVLN